MRIVPRKPGKKRVRIGALRHRQHGALQSRGLTFMLPATALCLARSLPLSVRVCVFAERYTAHHRKLVGHSRPNLQTWVQPPALLNTMLAKGGLKQ
eukprot:8253518-Pyramimonas_sp.AAC.1